MRHLTFQVKLPAAGEPTAEMLAPKSAYPKGSGAPFGALVQRSSDRAGHPLPPRPGTARREHERQKQDDPTDPRLRHAAQLGPPPGLAHGETAGQLAPPAPAAPADACARASLEHLLPALVRRVAWSGDGRRGTVRLELGSGELAGAELVVHAEDGRVRVQLRAPAGVDLGPLRERIAARLASRGLALEDVE